MVEIVILQCTVRDTLAQNCRMGIRLWSASYVQKHQQLNDKMNIYIYVYMYIYMYINGRIITVDVGHIKQQR